MRLPFVDTDSDGQNLTPLIDVVFLLLIFFLVATRFDEEEREIESRLPEVAEAQPLTKRPADVIVNITEVGVIRVVRKTYTLEELKVLLHAIGIKNPHQRVQIRADERVAWGYPAKVMGICESEDIEHYCNVLQEIGR